MLKIVGGVVVLWGIADLVLSWMGNDLWGMVGIQLPDMIWQYSHYIAIVVGGVIFSMGSKSDEETDESQ